MHALNRNIELTTEEQEELAKNSPSLLKAIEEGNPAASAGLAFWRRRRSMAEEAREQAEEIQRQVATAIEAVEPEQGSLGQWCGFPTDMTRCSPFFPMNSNSLGERKYLENYLITSANWGEIHYTGPQLSIYEEDVLLVLLAMISIKNKYIEYSEVVEQIDSVGKMNTMIAYGNCHFYGENNNIISHKPTFTYRGPILPLLKILHGKRNPTKMEYTRFINALKRMTVAGLELSIFKKNIKSGKRQTQRIAQMSSILSGVYWDDFEKELLVTVNPFFYEIYINGHITLMDVARRMSIKGLNAKALYRFVQSHRKNPVFVGNFLTLADVLNMDKEQPAWKIRQLLKVAIEELIRQEILTGKSGFMDTDIIKLERGLNTFPRKARAKNIRTTE